MSVEENKNVIRRVVEEVFNKGDMSIAPELIASNYVYHSPLGEFKGPEGFTQFVTMLRTAIPDLWAKVDEMVAEGDTIAARMSFGGTFTGKLGDYEPTGRPVNMSAAYFYHYKDGKEVEAIPFADSLVMAQQFGMNPPTG